MEKQTKRTRMCYGPYCINGLTLSIFLSLVLVCFGARGVLHATQEGLPDADMILDKYVEVTGGREAYEKIDNCVTTGTYEIVQAGIKATLTMYHARPNMMYTRTGTDAFGKIESGTNGDVAWDLSMMTGPKIRKGQERDEALCEAVFNKFVYWREFYEKAECVSVALIAGRPCYQVVMVPKTGNLQTFYFDQESNLLVKVESMLEHLSKVMSDCSLKKN